MKTEKEDWLNDLLADQPEIFVSGHAKNQSLLDMPEHTCAALRFLGNRNGPEAYILTIDAKRELWDEIFDKLNDRKSAAFEKIQIWKQQLGFEIPCIIYHELNPDEFGYHRDGEMVIDGRGLLDEFERMSPSLTKNNDSGRVKSINISVNDYFQRWGREHLSKYYIINDFDAISINADGHLTLYELKRVKEDLRTWEPYLDDKSNYSLLMSICRERKHRMRVIVYQVNNKDHVAIHQIISVSDEEIVGRRIICPPEHCYSPVIGEKYTSNRRRI